MDFATRLKTLRKQAKLTQEQLAHACGWPGQSRVANYESGAREPELAELPALAIALGVPVAELLSNSPITTESKSHFPGLDRAMIAQAKKWVAAEELIGGPYPHGELVDQVLAVYELMLSNGGVLTAQQRKERFDAAQSRLGTQGGERDGRGNKAVGGD